MAGKGPAPKRSSQRRRRNKPDKEVRTGAGNADTRQPPAKAGWHEVAKLWYESLGQSGQNKWYEPSDWAAAYMLAENMSRDLKPRVVGITDEGKVIKAQVPMTGGALNAYLRGMNALLVTEADRRQAGVELEKPRSEGEGDGDGGNVSWLHAARSS